MSKLPFIPAAAAAAETPTELKLSVGIAALAVLQFAFFAVGWAVRGWKPAFSPSYWMHLWWVDVSRLIGAVSVVVTAMAIVMGFFFVTVTLGDRLVAALRRAQDLR